jgi:hypothetical protein
MTSIYNDVEGGSGTHVDGTLFGKGTLSVEMIEEDDGSGHGAEAKHVGVIRLESVNKCQNKSNNFLGRSRVRSLSPSFFLPFLGNHVVTYIGHCGQSDCHIFSGNSAVLIFFSFYSKSNDRNITEERNLTVVSLRTFIMGVG